MLRVPLIPLIGRQADFWNCHFFNKIYNRGALTGKVKSFFFANLQYLTFFSMFCIYGKSCTPKCQYISLIYPFYPNNMIPIKDF